MGSSRYPTGGEIIATHARKYKDSRPVRLVANEPRPRGPKAPTKGPKVLRVVDGSGSVSFAGWSYRVGNPYKRGQVEVAIVNNTVQISKDGALLKVHPIRHDRSKEHGAFATPNGRPREKATGS
ncbi:MAG TPA: hypothetical protein VGP46_00695 [Acidimicrobiales bacterium]|nr:hypothetical protein [Acidimicrobiales bacterium]